MFKIRSTPALIGAAFGFLAAMAQQEVVDPPATQDFPRAGIVRVATRSPDQPSSSWSAQHASHDRSYEGRLQAVRERLRSPSVPEWFPAPRPPPPPVSIPPH